MDAEDHIRRCACGTRLARDNRGAQCNACAKKARGHALQPPVVPPEFWQAQEMREALDSCDMGAVMRAFRTHPHHGRDISQEVAARWVGISQTRLSRIENGEGISSLDRHMRWAHVLRVPRDLLWFRMPKASTPPNAVRTRAEQDAGKHVRQQRGALLPVMVDGCPVLIPVDADRMKARGLDSLFDGVETVSPLTRRSLLGRGIAAAALPMLGAMDQVPGRESTTAQLARLHQAPTLENARALVKRVHRSYQAARYHEVAVAVPPLMNSIQTLINEGPEDQRREALRLEYSAAVAKAKLETKAGDGASALGSAQRARRAAIKADDQFGQAAASYQLACAMLKLGQREEAELTAVESAEAIKGTDPESLTWRGALMLISSIIAARRNDRAEADARLNCAEALAEQLGADSNIGWTAFGPTNVSIHRMSAAVALTDPRATLAIAEQIDVVSMPSNLRGRQAQYHLDSAWAHYQLNEDMAALVHLLDTERTAPQLVLGAPAAQSLIAELMQRERRVQMPGLRSLALRAGVLV